MAASTTLTTTLEYSPRRAWVMIAPTMTATSPAAAMGASTGKMPSAGALGIVQIVRALQVRREANRARQLADTIVEGAAPVQHLAG
jgi:hypothetical protein